MGLHKIARDEGAKKSQHPLPVVISSITKVTVVNSRGEKPDIVIIRSYTCEYYTAHED